MKNELLCLYSWKFTFIIDIPLCIWSLSKIKKNFFGAKHDKSKIWNADRISSFQFISWELMSSILALCFCRSLHVWSRVTSTLLQNLIDLFLFSHWVMSNSLQPHGLQHTRPACPLLSPRVCSSLCPLSQWCYL